MEPEDNNINHFELFHINEKFNINNKSEARLIYYSEKLYVSVFLSSKSLIIKRILFITFNTRNFIY